MDGDGADVVGMGVEGGEALAGVEVVDAEVVVVRAGEDPRLPMDEADGADGQVGDVEVADERVRGVVMDRDVSDAISSGQQ